MCDYVASQKSNINAHKRTKHEGVRYPCNQCDFISKQRGDLKRHKDSVHGGIRYPCGECDHVATLKSNLKRHIKLKHTDKVGVADIKIKIENNADPLALQRTLSNVSAVQSEIKQEVNIDDPLSIIDTANNDHRNIVIKTEPTEI